eukprot:6418181-Alexandrium_andersonii.AAC.1
MHDQISGCIDGWVHGVHETGAQTCKDAMMHRCQSSLSCGFRAHGRGNGRGSGFGRCHGHGHGHGH